MKEKYLQNIGGKQVWICLPRCTSLVLFMQSNYEMDETVGGRVLCCETVASLMSLKRATVLLHERGEKTKEKGVPGRGDWAIS